MLVNVKGCSSLRTLFLVSVTYTSSNSATFYQPWFRYVDARLAMLVSVSGCSSPSTSLRSPLACNWNLSALFY